VALGIVAYATPTNASSAAGAAIVTARKRFCAIMEASKRPARFGFRSEERTRGNRLVQRERFNARLEK
jgi:hypothetical protein